MTANDDRLGEQVVVIFLASDEARTLVAIRQGLATMGLDVHVASAETTPSIQLDYKNARYLIILVDGSASEPPARATRVGRLSGIKTIVFPGTPVAIPPPGSVRLDVTNETWPVSLAEAILVVA